MVGLGLSYKISGLIWIEKYCMTVRSSQVQRWSISTLPVGYPAR